MAIDFNNSRFLVSCAVNGANFESTLTLGHLGEFVPSTIVAQFFKDYGLTPKVTPDKFSENEVKRDGFSDWFFHALGSKSLDFLDFSDYEGATIVHDLNEPIPSTLYEQFDMVVDGGTLEHVFNYPQALANAMMLAKVGGHLIIDQPINSCAGHGFYQVCPELFFRAFTEENGFELKRIVVCEDFPRAQWYEVADPMVVGARVTLATEKPVHALVFAKKIATFNGFKRWPAQADYQRSWENVTETKAVSHAPQSRSFAEAVRLFVRRIDIQKYWRFSAIRNYNKSRDKRKLSNLKHFTPVSR